MEELALKKYNGHGISVAFHDTGSKQLVVFCHGFRGSNVGPNRFFVRAARKLAKQEVSSFRFDQYGSGNSEGDFLDSSFKDWVENVQSITNGYLNQGYQVSLLGQSMGAAAAIIVGADRPNLSSVVAWAPDPNIDQFEPSPKGFSEEGGQRIQDKYWQEAHDGEVIDRLKQLKVPTYIVQCTADEHVDEQNRQAMTDAAQPNHQLETFEGYPHSSWTYDQAEEIIDKSINFILRNFE